MAGLWQRTGNVTVTNGSKTLTGFGTKWKTGTLPIQKGHTFYGPDNAAYEVDTVVSDTEILLVDTYRGGTLANQPYRIDITRTSTISQFAADLASLVAKYRSWFDGMMTWLTGSGDVAILNPDTGANVTIPSWKKVASEGEGQATRAKAEADKAAASAASAASAVSAASAPFPDVWAPLNDSLRLLAGYGREVKVGEDVVGRYVNFSRATTATYIDKSGTRKTAAINEPRFEPAGLLIEGASTNMVANSMLAPLGGGATVASDGDWFSVTEDTANTSHTASFGTLSAVPAGTYAFSLDLAPGKTGEKRYVALSVGSTGLAANHRATFDLISGSFTTQNAPANVFMERVGGVYRCTIVVTMTAMASVSLVVRLSDRAAEGLHTYQGDGASGCLIRAPQFEPLPFPTSYIPTNGAATTRAADAVSIPWPGNLEPLLSAGNKTTVAMEYSLMGTGTAHAHRIIISHFGDPAGAGNLLMRLNSGQSSLSFYRGAATTSQVDVGTIDRSGIAVARVKPDNTTNLFVNGTAYGGGSSAPVKTGTPLSLGIGGSSAGSFALFGHIRNLQLWNKDLSDAQIRALK
ncbi:LamG domain-containing protein [Aeromonas dhakensis]|uniref:LamG domain-containing protein n=1 Tax=Aeromonas dhakensis TaxID=196024 RepID=UPI001BFCCB7C|nr:LamG domain-containing protein [Aeromonas dhakensis]HDT5887736.1 hypothetical protein [Aeromonas dhakensis]HEB4979909.1 hypothetical protein [Aeromonas dhakensis]